MRAWSPRACHNHDGPAAVGVAGLAKQGWILPRGGRLHTRGCRENGPKVIETHRVTGLKPASTRYRALPPAGQCELRDGRLREQGAAGNERHHEAEGR
jgi:hypothetical protein